MRCLLAKDAPESIKKELVNYGFTLLFSVEDNRLPHNLQYHVDLQFLRLDNKIGLVLKGLKEYYESMLPDFTIIETEKIPTNMYPEDCLVNVLLTKKSLYCSSKTVDPVILRYAKKQDKEIHYVKQGYTNCSVLSLEKGYVTSDREIAKKLSKEEPTLKIKHKNILLHGYSYGFIGGTGGMINNKLFLSGSLKAHPSARNIQNFLNLVGVQVLELTPNKVMDIGGLYFL